MGLSWGCASLTPCSQKQVQQVQRHNCMAELPHHLPELACTLPVNFTRSPCCILIFCGTAAAIYVVHHKISAVWQNPNMYQM